MHNGVFATLDEVLEFHDRGGGVGLGLEVPKQTLPGSPRELTAPEKADLVAFMHALTDTPFAASAPRRLPRFPEKLGLNSRPVDGTYQGYFFFTIICPFGNTPIRGGTRLSS